MERESAFSCNDFSSFEKGKEKGEQLFTIRAQDSTATRVIAFWILENIDYAPEGKLRHALEAAIRARRWPDKKRSD